MIELIIFVCVYGALILHTVADKSDSGSDAIAYLIAVVFIVVGLVTAFSSW